MDGELLALQWMEHSRIFSHAIGNLRGKVSGAGFSKQDKSYEYSI